MKVIRITQMEKMDIFLLFMALNNITINIVITITIAKNISIVHDLLLLKNLNKSNKILD